MANVFINKSEDSVSGTFVTLGQKIIERKVLSSAGRTHGQPK